MITQTLQSSTFLSRIKSNIPYFLKRDKNLFQEESVAKNISLFLQLKGIKLSLKTLTDWAILNTDSNNHAAIVVPEIIRQWGGETVVQQLERVAPENLTLINTPCLISLDDGQAAILHSVDIELKTVDISFNTPAPEKMPMMTLASIWDGIFFSIDTSKMVSEASYNENVISAFWDNWRNSIIYTVILWSAVFIAINASQKLSQIDSGSIVWLSIVACLITGSWVSILISKYYLNGNSGNEGICEIGVNYSCKSIFDSDGAKLFGIPHADLGVAYFSGMLLLVLVNFSLSPLVMIMSSLGIFYTAYSLFYQKFVVKKWCVLCLLVQIVIIVLFILMLVVNHSYNDLVGHFSAENIFRDTIILMFSSVLWTLIRSQIKYRKDSIKWKNRAVRSWFNPEMIVTSIENSLDLKVPPLATDLLYASKNPENKSSENSTNSLDLFILLSASCNGCAKIFTELKSVIDTDSWPIKSRLRIFSDPLTLELGKEDPSHQVALRILALQHSDGNGTALNALDTWFTEFKLNNYEAWCSTLREFSDTELEDCEAILEETQSWLIESDIDRSPTAILGDKVVPLTYQNMFGTFLRKFAFLQEQAEL